GCVASKQVGNPLPIADSGGGQDENLGNRLERVGRNSFGERTGAGWAHSLPDVATAERVRRRSTLCSSGCWSRCSREFGWRIDRGRTLDKRTKSFVAFEPD